MFKLNAKITLIKTFYAEINSDELNKETVLYCKSGDEKPVGEIAAKTKGLLLLGPLQIEGRNFWCTVNRLGRSKRDIDEESEVKK